MRRLFVLLTALTLWASPAFGGSFVTTSSDLDNVYGILDLPSGGTGANLTAAQGGLVYSGASSLAIQSAGTSGYFARSGGAGAPTWFDLFGTANTWTALQTFGAGLTVSGGTLTFPTPFTLGATSVTTTGTQLNYLASATGTTGTTSTNIVFSTSPTLITPSLGTPSALVLTNATGLPAASVLAGTFGSGAYVMDTTLTLPTLIGGTGTTSTLSLQSTSGVGAAGADIIFKVGNNGGTEAGRFNNAGLLTLPVGLTVSGGTFNVSSAGPHGFGGGLGPQLDVQMYQGGTFTTGITGVVGYQMDTTLTPATGGVIRGMQLAPNLTTRPSGTHADVVGLRIEPTITSNGASLTNYAGLHIPSVAVPGGGLTGEAAAILLAAPTGANNNYALQVNSGISRFPAGSVSAPSITFGGYNTTGIYDPIGNEIGFAVSGVRKFVIDSGGLYIDTTIFPYTSNANDIGAAANAIRTLYVGTSSILQGANGQAYTQGRSTQLVSVGSGISTKATTIQIPADAIVYAVPVRVKTQPGGTSTMTVTATTSGTAFQKGASISTAAGTTDPGTKNTPVNYNAVAAQTVTLTFDAPTTDALGEVRIDIYYATSTPPTS